MVIDLRKCIGCSACTVDCIAENHPPPGMVYRPVLEEEIGKYPHVTRRFTPRPRMQCDNPPCVPVCPVTATYKRPDGVVEINYEQCIGCRFCMAACLYNAKFFNWHTYEKEQPGQNPDVSLRPIIAATFAWTACRWENFVCKSGIRSSVLPTLGLQSSATVR